MARVHILETHAAKGGFIRSDRWTAGTLGARRGGLGGVGLRPRIYTVLEGFLWEQGSGLGPVQPEGTLAGVGLKPWDPNRLARA